MGRHHDKIDILVTSHLYYFVSRVTSEQHAFDRNPIEFWLQCLIQIFLSPLDDVRMQIPRGDLVPALQPAGGIAERRHHVQQDHLCMKAARQSRGLVHDVLGSIREHNRSKNFLNTQHHATYQLREPIRQDRRHEEFLMLTTISRWESIRRAGNLVGLLQTHPLPSA